MTYDPVNPAHYAGRTCADIGECLTANGYQILKYVWRLGKKDDPFVELGKAVWYADSECQMLSRLWVAGVTLRRAPLVLDLQQTEQFIYERIVGQPEFTQQITRLLWRGYNHNEMQVILDILTKERDRYASS